jgi:DNA-binding response OmpR family regulator
MEKENPLLIVEDDALLSRSLVRVLGLAGFKAVCAYTGEEGIRLAAELNPKVAILDIGLPDMKGYEVSRRIREVCRPWRVRILMLTGLAEPIDKLRGFAFGADAYLTKPCSDTELLKTIRLLSEDYALT